MLFSKLITKQPSHFFVQIFVGKVNFDNVTNLFRDKQHAGVYSCFSVRYYVLCLLLYGDLAANITDISVALSCSQKSLMIVLLDCRLFKFPMPLSWGGLHSLHILILTRLVKKKILSMIFVFE